MFNPEEYFLLKNKVIIGVINFQKPDLNNLKVCLSKQDISELEYRDINQKTIEQRIKIQREKSNSEGSKIGMISKNWLNKYQNEIPCVIIQIIDITIKIIENKDPSLISEDIIKEMGVVKSAYMSSNYILIIKNLYKSNFDSIIKNNILNNIKYAKDKNIIIMNDNNKFDDMTFIKNLSDLVLEELNIFFYNKKKNYYYKYEICKQKKETEFSIKYLLKLFTLSLMTHKDNINYSYLFKANLFLRQKLDRKNYKFISALKSKNNKGIQNIDLITKFLIYFELRNINDYIIYYLITKKNMEENDINKLVYQHLLLFDINNILKVNGLNELKTNKDYSNIDNIIKYLFIFDLIWKLSWYLNKENIVNNKNKNKEKIELANNNIIFSKFTNNFYFLNNLLKLFNFVKKEKDFIQKDIMNKYGNYKYKQVNNKFIEKIPFYYEVDENDKEKNELNIEESLYLHMNLIILKYKEFLDDNILYNKLQLIKSSQKYNSYLFYLIINYNLININNLQNEKLFIKQTLEHFNNNNNKIMKFPKIYEDYLNKIYLLFIKDDIDNNLVDKNIKRDLIIKYLTVSRNSILSNEELNLINNLINDRIDNNEITNIFNLDNNDNNFIDLKIIYKGKDTSNDNNTNNILIKALDCLNIEIILSVKKDGIFLDVEKVQIFFNSEINSLNNVINNNANNYKEIDISNKISKENAIYLNFNHLIKNMPYHHFVIDKITIILRNKSIINIKNTIRDKNIILYDKSFSEQKIIQIINYNSNINNNYKLFIGEKEYYLYSLKYKKEIDNDNIVISKISGKIELKKCVEKEDLNDKNFYLLEMNKKDNNNNNFEKILLYEENQPIYDKEIHFYNFLIKINKTGQYCLLYNIKFKIIHKDCLEESLIIEENGKINLDCIQPFDFKTKLESSLYSIQGKDNKISYPKNYPIKFNILLSNNLNKKIIIKNINFENSLKYIKINSPFLNIINKKGQNIILSKGEKLTIPNKLFVNNNIESSIGILKIIWVSIDLNDFEETKNFYNETMIELDQIIIKEINYKIEGNFIYHKNHTINNCLSYQLKVKNLYNLSKIIHCELFNKDNNIHFSNQKGIVNYGKTILKDIILPKNELIFLFHFYNINERKDDEENIIIDSKYNNLIKIDEYSLDNYNEKEPYTDLTKQIFFVPELYSQFNINV